MVMLMPDTAIVYTGGKCSTYSLALGHWRSRVFSVSACTYSPLTESSGSTAAGSSVDAMSIPLCFWAGSDTQLMLFRVLQTSAAQHQQICMQRRMTYSALPACYCSRGALGCFAERGADLEGSDSVSQQGRGGGGREWPPRLHPLVQAQPGPAAGPGQAGEPDRPAHSG